MGNYRYVEFTDRTGSERRLNKSGKLYIVGEVTDDLIKELNLRDALEGKAMTVQRYYSTFDDLTRAGWELAFVTPCAISLENGSYVKAGGIENAYIFKKEI